MEWTAALPRREGEWESGRGEEKEREEIGNRSEHCSNRRARFDMTNREALKHFLPRRHARPRAQACVEKSRAGTH